MYNKAIIYTYIKRRYKVVSIGLLGGLHYLFMGGILSAEWDVVWYGAGKQDWLLTHNPNVISEPHRIQFCYIVST